MLVDVIYELIYAASLPVYLIPRINWYRTI